MRRTDPERRRLLQWLAASGLAAQAPQALAQAAPTRAEGPARLLFGIPPGAAGTKLAEAVLNQLAGSYTPPYKLEHALGRDGRRSAELTKSARPDGLTVLHAQSALLTLFPAVYRELGYAPQTDLTPIASLSQYAFMLLVGPRVPAEVRTLDAYLAWVGDNPASRQVGTVLRGSQGWLMARQLARDREAPLQAVSYASSATVVADLLGGGLAAGFVVTGNGTDALRDGRLRVLAVSSAQRWVGMPETPTFAEQGLKDMVMTGWYGWFGPAGMPEELTRSLRRAVDDVMASEPITKVLQQLDMMPARWSPQQITERIASETGFYAEAVRQARLERI